ncbi:hypothetical protein [Haematobacter sp. UBA3484]|uniref:hypothetical protein n=1 Tax=Haematobacter sp. UBA3484 TaxID=1946582 RepID=UPI0025BB5C75|nr:hypothetical protein [Haematobacter sp. UBA3484]
MTKRILITDVPMTAADVILVAQAELGTLPAVIDGLVADGYTLSNVATGIIVTVASSVVVPALTVSPSTSTPALGDVVTLTFNESPDTVTVIGDGEIIPTSGSGVVYTFIAYTSGPTSISATKEGYTSATASIAVGTIAPDAPRLVRSYDMPSRVAGRVPAGFTCTGLSLITTGDLSGYWLAADDGRLVEGDSSIYVPAVHILTPDLSTILRTISVGNSTHSAQGVAFDGSDGTFWVALSASGYIRHYTLEGVEITEDAINVRSVSGLTAWNPNALAYIPSLDQLWCASSAGKVVRRFYCSAVEAAAAGSRHVANSGITIAATGTNTDNSPDQFHWDGSTLFYSMGANASNGAVYRVPNALAQAPGATNTAILTWTLPGATAIEGIHYDPASHTLWSNNDRGYHNSGNAANKNQGLRFLVPAI